MAALTGVTAWAHAAGVAADSPGLRLVEHGKRHVVLVDPVRGRVYRFPRHDRDLTSLPERAARLATVAGLGLPVAVPGPAAPVVPGPTGWAHQVDAYVPGVGMDDPRVAAMPEAQRVQLGRDLARLLAALRRVSAADWPWPATDWVDLWEGEAAAVLDRLVPRLPPDLALQARSDFDAALAAARRAPRGLIHGDVGGVNVHVDLATGGVCGVIDWDGATMADPAIDLQAILATADPVVAAALVEATPTADADLGRADAYLATWRWQGALWALDHGHEELLGELLLASS